MSSIRKITADKIYCGDGNVLTDTVLVLDTQGKVLGFESAHTNKVYHYHGAICPGFVNAHCHLELSNLAGALPTGLGLPGFVSQIVRLREINKHLQGMLAGKWVRHWQNSGVVAVGDIANTNDVLALKEASAIRFHTLMERHDTMQTGKIVETAKEILALAANLTTAKQHSMVPHAPYTDSPEMLQYIVETNKQLPSATLSVHNQECEAENEFMRYGTGLFKDIYDRIGLPLTHLETNEKGTMGLWVKYLDPTMRTLFVHNVFSTKEDIELAHAWNTNVYWATCPNANLFIEGRLPDYRLFVNAGAKVCIGTDSMASNWQLDMLCEMKAISTDNAWLDTNTLIQWATQNGALALGFDDLGVIGVGKTPGLVHLSTVELTADTFSKRII
jgi:aminodeoxyfutalosine deaminase